jgi:hypothetical protein
VNIHRIENATSHPARLVDAGDSLPGSPVGQDTVDFVSLAQPGTLTDCGTTTPAVLEPCRVRRHITSSVVRDHLTQGQRAWRDGDMITFAHEDSADAVTVVGGLQLPMSPIHGTRIWVVSVRIPRIDAAFISFAFLPQGGKSVPPTRLSFEIRRGAEGLAAPLRAVQLKGQVVRDSIASAFLSESRSVSAYVPPGQGPPDFVVYMADGQSVAGLAPVLDTLIATGALPRILLVGAFSSVTCRAGAPSTSRLEAVQLPILFPWPPSSQEGHPRSSRAQHALPSGPPR